MTYHADRVSPSPIRRCPRNRIERRNRSLIMAPCFLLQLLICIISVAAAHPLVGSHSNNNRYGRRNNAEEDGNDLLRPEKARVRIHPFQLVLTETPTALTTAQQDEIKEIAESLLSDMVMNKSLPEGTSLDYLLLANIEENVFSVSAGGGGEGGDRQLRNLLSKTMLQFGGGVASFEGEGAPRVGQLGQWIEEALQDDLPAALQTAPSQSYSDVTSVAYISLTPSPTPAPVDQSFGGVEQGNYFVEDEPNVPLIAGLAVGGFVFVAAVAALMVMQRRKRAAALVQNASKEGDDATHVNSSYDQDGSAPNANISMDESLDGSSSDFTLSTTDNTIRSMATRRYAPKPGHYRTESFEQDRQVSLHKDILLISPAWAIEASSNPYETYNTGNDNDTVLEPSHFVAAESEQDDEYDMESHLNSGSEKDGDSARSPFLFEGGEGEEVYLMPASRSRNHQNERLVSYQLEQIDEEVDHPVEL